MQLRCCLFASKQRLLFESPALFEGVNIIRMGVNIVRMHIKALYKSPYSITEIGTLVKVYGLVRMDLKQLVTEPQPLILNQDVNELTLF